MQIRINYKNVRVFGKNANLAVKSRQFKDWVRTLDPDFLVKSVTFQSVDVGSHGRKPQVRFIKFKANVTDPQGGPLPGITFMRGGSVAILVVLECEGEEYTILTVQPRFPAGNFAFPEIPAGTMEDESFVGAAARELKEETRTVIRAKDLIDLTELTYGSTYNGVFSSPGGSDEYFRLFLLRKKVGRRYLRSLQGKLTGLDCENEKIALKVVKLQNLPFEAPDAKSLSAFVLYQLHKNQLFKKS